MVKMQFVVLPKGGEIVPEWFLGFKQGAPVPAALYVSGADDFIRGNWAKAELISEAPDLIVQCSHSPRRGGEERERVQTDRERDS